jgi:uncharacterized RDD family membrane protein YckC
MTARAAHPVVGAHEEVHVTGRRILATLVDYLIFAAVGSAMAYYFGTFTVHDAFGVEFHLTGVAWLIFSGLIAVYYVLMEGYLGQTVGKMVVGIKVVGEGSGEVPGFKAAAIRTLLRLVDGLASYLVAFVAILFTPERQRLGDMATHTLVVHKVRWLGAAERRQRT